MSENVFSRCHGYVIHTDTHTHIHLTRGGSSGYVCKLDEYIGGRVYGERKVVTRTPNRRSTSDDKSPRVERGEGCLSFCNFPKGNSRQRLQSFPRRSRFFRCNTVEHRIGVSRHRNIRRIVTWKRKRGPPNGIEPIDARR